MEKIKVLIWGFGAMGGGMASMLLKKQGVEITGICDAHPDRVGKNFKDVLNQKNHEHKDVIISDNIDEADKMIRKYSGNASDDNDSYEYRIKYLGKLFNCDLTRDLGYSIKEEYYYMLEALIAQKYINDDKELTRKRGRDDDDCYFVV